MPWLDIAWIVGGLVLLVGGGELLVRGASGLALLARITPAVVGLTVVAAGTSMPELVVSMQAALRGSPGLAVGNIVGSNIFNIAAILGIAAMVRPLVVRTASVRLEWPIVLLASCQLLLLARDGEIDRLEGGFLALGMVVFVAYMVRVGRSEVSTPDAEHLSAEVPDAPSDRGARAWAVQGGLALVGTALLAGGAHGLVTGATSLARDMGVSETVIGLTIVALGTSLPELAASVVAAYRGNTDIAVANVLGSNVFNCLGIGGLTALVHPLDVEAEIVSRDGAWMCGLTLALFPILRSGMRVGRVEGAFLTVAFAGYLTMLFLTT